MCSTLLRTCESSGGKGPGTLRQPDLRAALLWLGTRLALLAGSLALAAAPHPATDGGGAASFVDRWLGLWQRWDATHFATVARSGWTGPGSVPNDAAFLPGLPVVLRVLAAVGLSPGVAGLLVSLLAGTAAAVGLARLARLEDPSGRTGLVAVGLLGVAPPTVFLTAGYSEALFLSLAVWAWWAARTDRWWLAAVLAALAVTVRVHGLFLTAGLVVLAVVSVRQRRPRLGPLVLPRLWSRLWPRLLPLLLPCVAAALLLLAYRASTGDTLAWLHAQSAGWGRAFTDPVTSWRRTWAAAFGGTQAAPVAVVFALELLAGILALLGLVVLLTRRRWADATYVALSVGAMETSTWWISLFRTLLVVFPLWLLAARLLTPATPPQPDRRVNPPLPSARASVRWLPLAVVVALSGWAAVWLAHTFLTGGWAG